MAIGNGHYETVKWLLENGANPNAKTITDTTLIIEVATAKISEKSKIKMTQLLLENGSNPCKFAMFRKGDYGTKETTSAFSQATYLKAAYIAFHKGEEELGKMLVKAEHQWKLEHPSLGKRILNGLCVLAQLATGKEKTKENQKPKPNKQGGR